MSKLKIVVVITVTVLMISQFVFSTNATAQPKFGIGAVGGFSHPFCDYPKAGNALSGGAIGRYLMSDRFNLSLGIGFSRLADENSEFTSFLNSIDLMANFNLVSTGSFIPYASIGLGAFSFEYYNYPKNFPLVNGIPTPTRIPNGVKSGSTFYDGSLILGAGVDLFVSPQVALTALADYRFTMGDDIDGINNADLSGSKDGYLNARFGLTYYMGQRSARQQSDDDLLALEQVEFSEVEDDILAQLESGDDFSSTPLPQTTLQTRYQELSQNINAKQQEINSLQQDLSFKDQRIADLEKELQTSGGSTRGGVYSSAGSGSFSNDYQNALQVYYTKDFSKAIGMFQDLKKRFPDHKLISNCDYWIGESYFAMADYKMAIQSFQNVFTHSFSYKKDDATLMLGRCYMKINDYNNARTMLQDLINKYPDSEYIGKAKEWLSRIG
ncbi:MAG TPA: tetratricopeptide repeat protein [bacterium]|nr:tetratricopeptide repeat protein [bacterium]HPN45411.1 tetratricopeptide repeat protein [bacterium]